MLQKSYSFYAMTFYEKGLCNRRPPYSSKAPTKNNSRKLVQMRHFLFDGKTEILFSSDSIQNHSPENTFNYIFQSNQYAEIVRDNDFPHLIF